MNLYVGLTDRDWWEYVARTRPVEANFWRPRDTREFRSLRPGDLFLFKLRKEHGGQIVGGAYFVRQWNLTPEVAWDAFEGDNGVATREEFFARLGGLGGRGGGREIGCLLLSEPFSLTQPFEVPDWPPSTVQGKTYDVASTEGASIFDAVRGQGLRVGELFGDRVAQVRSPYDEPTEGGQHPVRTRIGQGEFRLRTLENYRYTCAVTGEHTVPALEAAHILPVARRGRHRLDNGLCLRADVHRLFDRGLIAITPEYRIIISREIGELYLNGKPYYIHDGAELRALPEHPSAQPDRAALAAHVESRFRR